MYRFFSFSLITKGPKDIRIAIININKAWKSSKKYILVDFGPWDYKPKIIFEKYYK